MNRALKDAILATGLKQYRIASLLGIGPTRLSKILYGHALPTKEEKEAIAKTLGVPVTEAFPDDLGPLAQTG